MEEGHTDVRYRRTDERGWTPVRVRGVRKRPSTRETPFPPTAKAVKERMQKPKTKSSDALFKRLPGSFESGKRR
jgi:hypothetical protein